MYRSLRRSVGRSSIVVFSLVLSTDPSTVSNERYLFLIDYIDGGRPNFHFPCSWSIVGSWARRRAATRFLSWDLSCRRLFCLCYDGEWGQVQGKKVQCLVDRRPTSARNPVYFVPFPHRWDRWTIGRLIIDRFLLSLSLTYQCSRQS